MDTPTSPELPVVLLSHRGPASFSTSEQGRTISRGGGGLVSALMGLAEHLDDAVWVWAATSDEDRAVLKEYDGGAVELVMWPEPRIAEPDTENPTLAVRYVEVDP